MTQQPFWLGPENAERACLLIHGFSGSPPEMHELGEALAEQGIRVYGMLVAGHEGDEEQLVSSGRKQWIASTEEALAQLAQYRHVFVAGLSMGGTLALLLAIRHPERIAGVIALSTPTRIGGFPSKLLPVLRYFVKWYYPLRILNFNNPKVQEEVLKQARQRDPNVTIDFSDTETVNHIKKIVRLPVPALAELFALVNQERLSLRRLRSPLLIIQSKRDQTVSPMCAEEIYRLAVVAHPKSLHWLETSDHVITTGPERKEVSQLTISFIDTIVPGVATPAQLADAQPEAEDGTPPGH